MTEIHQDGLSVPAHQSRDDDEPRLMAFYGGPTGGRSGSGAVSSASRGLSSFGNDLVSGSGNSAERVHTQPAFSSAYHHPAWATTSGGGGFDGFLPSDSPSAWDSTEFVYSAESGVQPQHGDRFDAFFGARAAEAQSGITWTATSEAVTDAADQHVAALGTARRNSSASSSAESSCSSACGEQCEPCEREECALDQCCDASDCDDEPACASQCCPVYTCEETKAAATLASFGGEALQPACPSLSQQPQNQDDHDEHGHAVSARDDASSAHHAHCDSSMMAPQTVIQHLIENHNDPSGRSCVRPCLVDQPWNYASCPMTCLVEHPQLHDLQWPIDPGPQLHTTFDWNLLSSASPEALADDCAAHWTSGDELLQHWHIQHRALLLQAQEQHQAQQRRQQQYQHQLTHAFEATPSDQHFHAASYLPPQEDPSVQSRISPDSSPVTVGTATSPITPIAGPSTTYSSSPPPDTSSGQENSSTMGDSFQQPGLGSETSGVCQCLWCDTPSGSPCGRIFSTPRELNLHVIGYHVKILERTEGGYDCGWQGCKRRSEGKKGFPQKSKIERHVQTHTGDKPYACPTCNMTFSAKQALDQHELIHKGSKPLPCGFPGCDKTFRQQSARTMHMRTHTKSKPLACSVCGRRFSESSNLSKHRRTHADVGAFECGHEGCSKTFHRLDQLRRHQKTHEAKLKGRRGKLKDPAAMESASVSSDASEVEPL